MVLIVLVEGGVKQNLYLERGRWNGEGKLKWMLTSPAPVSCKGKGGTWADLGYKKGRVTER